MVNGLITSASGEPVRNSAKTNAERTPAPIAIGTVRGITDPEGSLFDGSVHHIGQQRQVASPLDRLRQLALLLG